MASVKKRSPLWKHFEINNNDQKFVTCFLCSAKISRGGEGKKAGTSAMKNHIRTKHPNEFLALNQDFAGFVSNTTSSDIPGTNSSSVAEKQLTNTASFDEDSHDESEVYSTAKRPRCQIMGQLQQKQKFRDNKQTDNNEEETCHIREISKNTVDIDEYDLFGQQIALKMKKMDDYMRIETQHKINHVLYEAEMKILK